MAKYDPNYETPDATKNGTNQGNTQQNNTYTGYTYDLDVDYMAEMKKAVDAGDYVQAAKLEQQRNQKVADLNKNGTNQWNAQQTNLYSAYLNGGNGSTLNSTTKGYENHQAEAQQAGEFLIGTGNGNKTLTREERAAILKEMGLDPALLDQSSQNGGYTQDREYAISRGGTGEAVGNPGYKDDGLWYFYEGDRREVGSGSGADEHFMSDGDYAIIQANKAEWMNLDAIEKQAAAVGDTKLVEFCRAEKDKCHEINERIRMGYGYVGGTDGSAYHSLGAAGLNSYDPVTEAIYHGNGREYTYYGGSSSPNKGGSSGGSSGGSYLGSSTNYPSGGNTTGGTGGGTNYPSGGISGVTGNYGNTMVSDMKDMLSQWEETAKQQSAAKTDYAVSQGVAQLERALADAQPQFKEQAESVDMNARQSMDNSALYAEMRGDKGGIGQEQYNSIQNTAAANQLAVQQAQTKLATDTQRQIADLRAQGEFEKADAALSITQEYLSKLMSLEQWAAQYNLSVEQFNAQLAQWEMEYQLSLKQLEVSQSRWEAEYDLSLQQFQAGLEQWQQKFDADNYWNQQQLDFNKQQQSDSNYWKEQQLGYDNYWNQQELDFSQQKYLDSLAQNSKEQMAEIAWALLQAGVELDAAQLESLGISPEQASALLLQAQITENASSGVTGEEFSGNLEQLYTDAKASGSPEVYLANNYKKYGLTSSSGLLDGYKAWLTKENASTKDPNGDGIADASVSALGLGNIGFAALEDMVEQGILTMKTNELGLIVVNWAPGWSASKYKNYMLI